MKLYYSITEVAQMLGVNTSHLRFLEGQFPELKPVKNKRGVRSYQEKDVELLRRILHLTKDQKFTLEGAHDQLKESQRQEAAGHNSQLDERMQLVDTLQQLRAFLVELKEML